MTDWIPEDDWATIVQSVPIPSIDIVPVVDDGIVLAQRTNEPAKGEWFVPGGRIRKGEKIDDAVHRVAAEELGVDVTIRERLGAFSHFYDVADVEGTDKHYVAHGSVADVEEETFELDAQHSDVKVFTQRPDSLHQYVIDYLDAASASPV